LVAQTEAELIDVLRASLYPGASDQSIKMAIGYCKAAKLDPIQKPVHIVSMKVKTGLKSPYGKDVYDQRDVIMPGIGLYRIQAARTGAYAGMDKPVFGPTQELHFQKKTTQWSNGKGTDTYVDSVVRYPEWCEVTVYRLIGGVRCPFTAVEYWLENYATIGNSDTPNEMWARRPVGQVTKCCESQALRKGFPEVGSQPTAEEMEGRTWHPEDEVVTVGQPKLAMPKAIELPAHEPEPEREPGQDDEEVGQDEGYNHVPLKPAGTVQGTYTPAPAATQSDSSGLAGEGQKKFLLSKGAALQAALKATGIVGATADLAGLTNNQFNALRSAITQRAA
jgi:phage recombination protein Bet